MFFLYPFSMWLVDTKTINRFSKPISQFVLYQGRRDTMKVSFFFLDCFFFLFLVFFAGSCDKQSNMTLVTNLWAMAQEVLLKGHHPPCQTQKKKDTFFHKCLYKLLDMCIETLFLFILYRLLPSNIFHQGEEKGNCSNECINYCYLTTKKNYWLWNWLKSEKENITIYIYTYWLILKYKIKTLFSQNPPKILLFLWPYY